MEACASDALDAYAKVTAMTEAFILREFKCKECGHMVVVHPELPQDYTPNICTPCYDRKEAEMTAKLFKTIAKLIR